MDTTTIIKKINEIRYLKRYEKDGGIAFVAALAKEFNSYTIVDRNEVINFFIDELKEDSYGMRTLALPILENMNVREAASRIFETYLHYFNNTDEKWEKEFVTILLKLQYTEPKEFYSNYINKYINDKEDDGYIFFLGTLYCMVEPDKAINLLANYFCKHLSAPNLKMEAFFKNRMGFLVGYFSKITVDYIPYLIKQTIQKNQNAGLRLKEIMLHYFHSDLVRDDKKEFIIEKINVLNSIN